MLPAKRKLNFDSPNESTQNFETDSSFPKEWIIDGVNIDERIEKLRTELRAKGMNPIGNPGVDPKSKFRTEYRRILAAHTIVNDALRLQKKEFEWFKNSTELLGGDIEALNYRREHVDNAVNQLKKELSRLDSSVGILKSQQLAVKSVLELREDEYMPDDADSNLPDEYQKFSKISKLCDIALKSYDNVKKRNEQMQKELMAERNRQRKHHEAMLNLMDEKERKRVEELDDLLKNFSLEELMNLRDRIRETSK